VLFALHPRLTMEVLHNAELLVLRFDVCVLYASIPQISPGLLHWRIERDTL
jgi:hypothetical protein